MLPEQPAEPCGLGYGIHLRDDDDAPPLNASNHRAMRSAPSIAALMRGVEPAVPTPRISLPEWIDTALAAAA
jgi:hypothetical protein